MHLRFFTTHWHKRGLLFFAVEEVAAVAQAGADEALLVEFVVDVASPEGDVIGWEFLVEILDGLIGGDYAGEVYVLRLSLGEQSLLGQLHRPARGEHGVDEEQHLVGDTWRGHVIDIDAELVGVGYELAIGAHESVLGMVEVA